MQQDSKSYTEEILTLMKQNQGAAAGGAASQPIHTPAPQMPPPPPAPIPAPKKGKQKKGEEVKVDGKFYEDCMNLKIDAGACFAQSAKNSDETITDHLMGINKKILDETQSGGYSTHITFQVSNTDWVNVQHIVDWYKARGFEILNYETGIPPYGTAGIVEHRFTISWANAKQA